MDARNHRLSRFVVTAAALSATIVAATVVHPRDQAHAGDAAHGETVTTKDVSEALGNAPEGLVRDAVVDTGPSRVGTPVQGDTPFSINIPTDPSQGVGLVAGDFSLTIGLPNADAASTAEQAADGAVAYPSVGDSANAVVPVRGGVQLLSVIRNQDASEQYSYPLTLPVGHSLQSTADGGAQVVDAYGDVRVVFEPAWAKDAAGMSVPTRYHVEGNTLTQFVEHRSASGVTYPVVADPLPIVLIVITTAAAIAVAAVALGIATWIALNWWNYCRSRDQYPQLSTRDGFTARCVD